MPIVAQWPLESGGGVIPGMRSRACTPLLFLGRRPPREYCEIASGGGSVRQSARTAVVDFRPEPPWELTFPAIF
jgi:hypothetical protein